MTGKIRCVHPQTSLTTQNLKNSLKRVYGKAKRNLGKIIVLGIYEGVVIKYLYDLHRVLSDPHVSGTVWRGRLPIAPVRAELFPWPTLFFDLKRLIVKPPQPIIIFTRPMSEIEYILKFFYDNPILQVAVILTPLIIYGVYYRKNILRAQRIVE